MVLFWNSNDPTKSGKGKRFITWLPTRRSVKDLAKVKRQTPKGCHRNGSKQRLYQLQLWFCWKNGPPFRCVLSLICSHRRISGRRRRCVRPATVLASVSGKVPQNIPTCISLHNSMHLYIYSMLICLNSFLSTKRPSVPSTLIQPS